MTEEQLNKFFDGITAHNKDMLDREQDAEKRTDDFLALFLIRDDNKVSMKKLLKVYPEDSEFKDCGSKSEIDVFFKKINESGIEPELMDYLKEHLTDEEIRERLTEDNFMSLVVIQKFIDDFLKCNKIKEIQHKIDEKEYKLIKLKSFFEKFKTGHHQSTFNATPNLNDRIIEHINREEFEFDWDDFLKETK